MTDTQIPINFGTKKKLENEMPYKLTFDDAVNIMIDYIKNDCNQDMRQLFLKKMNQSTNEVNWVKPK